MTEPSNPPINPSSTSSSSLPSLSCNENNTNSLIKIPILSSNKTKNSSKSDPPVPKKRRVRTGCLTCRERHLKCDEGTPMCNNCLKSHRNCRRGIKLNFMETKVTSPKTLVPFPHQHFAICDESRAIAAEYKGGLSSYPELKTEISTRDLTTLTRDQISTNKIETTALFISKDSSKKRNVYQGDKMYSITPESENIELNSSYAFVTLPNDSNSHNKLSYVVSDLLLLNLLTYI